jgi:AraC family transcriptional regulator, regulatory protein of adaptative response / methylated-DNA-[protein]-cysteine methyltransferase
MSDISKFQTEMSRWAAVQSRDTFADGKFVYCVKTTGIYCRPVCKARLARRANVTFHGDSNAAEADGFRPCLRCKPELERYDPQYEVISKACFTMQASAAQGKEPTLKDLAAESGLTKSHFHRVFKSIMGVTPKTHAVALLKKDGATAEVPNSRPGSLMPSVDDLSSDSKAQQTLHLVDTPLAVGKWQDSCAPMASGPATIPKKYSSCLQSQIELTIQPWQSGYVLIAAANDGLRAIDVGDNCADLMAMMRRRFPVADLLVSDWARRTASKRTCNSTELLFASVMEALENPTGKILHLPRNVFEVSG